MHTLFVILVTIALATCNYAAKPSLPASVAAVLTNAASTSIVTSTGYSSSNSGSSSRSRTDGGARYASSGVVNRPDSFSSDSGGNTHSVAHSSVATTRSAGCGSSSGGSCPAPSPVATATNLMLVAYFYPTLNATNQSAYGDVTSWGFLWTGSPGVLYSYQLSTNSQTVVKGISLPSLSGAFQVYVPSYQILIGQTYLLQVAPTGYPSHFASLVVITNPNYYTNNISITYFATTGWLQVNGSTSLMPNGFAPRGVTLFVGQGNITSGIKYVEVPSSQCMNGNGGVVGMSCFYQMPNVPLIGSTIYVMPMVFNTAGMCSTFTDPLTYTVTI